MYAATSEQNRLHDVGSRAPGSAVPSATLSNHDCVCMQPAFDLDGMNDLIGMKAQAGSDARNQSDASSASGATGTAGVSNDSDAVASVRDVCQPDVRQLNERQWIEETLARLSKSDFRAKFRLSPKDRSYARAKGREVIARHARELLAARIGAASPRNDGRQTPWKGHPVFTAQHATATCCRGCVAKWHHIPQGRELSDDEITRLANLVIAWIERDLANHPAA